ncbi:MAG: transporter [Chitinophagaceae bacterium]|nr:transporter [Chitinophagaceae bacterium]
MKKIKNHILHIVFCFPLGEAFSQINPINTDRPDQGDGVFTIPKNSWQLENGLIFAKQTIPNNLLLRYGITQSTELRLVTDAGKEMQSTGLKPIVFSVKQRLIQQKKIIPAISFVGYISNEKWASKNFRGNDIQYELKLAMENEISDKFSLGYNVGASNEFKNLNITAGISYAASNKISTYVEYFSSLSKAANEHNADIGVLYLLKPQLQLDISVGNSLFSKANRFYATTGVSYWFK